MSVADEPTTVNGMTTHTSPTTDHPTTSATTSATTPGSTSATPAGAGTLRRVAGYAAFVKAATYVIGLSVMIVHLVPRGLAEAQGDPAAALAFLQQYDTVLYAWYAVLYLVGGLALVSLSLGVGAHLRGRSPAAATTSTALGVVWAGLLLASGLVYLVGQQAVLDLATTDTRAAELSWMSISVVQDALGGGIEIVGAAWILLVAVTGLRTRAFSRALGAIGIGVGIAGMWTTVPGIDGAAEVFGLGFVVWFVMAGLELLRRSEAPSRA